MKSRIIKVGICFALLMMLLTAAVMAVHHRSTSEETRRIQTVTLNEITELYKKGEPERADRLADELYSELRAAPAADETDLRPLLYCAGAVCFMAAVLCYVYFSVLRPFEKMKRFADEIAGGNLDLPLDYERSNYFGSFTWAFDSMRREITKARRCEREAIENNKTVIATLSHDIKTPIASIRAYAEGLEANMDSTPEKRARYLSVIMRKCDEVSALTNDLFLHSLADLDKLKMDHEPIALGSFIGRTLTEIAGEQNDVHFIRPDEELTVLADQNRLTQLCENLVNNARKYAGTDITVTLSRSGRDASLVFSDRGSGIPDEDMPFITDKFYRGHNVGHEQGSGLGLYIVSYIASQLGGRLTLRNRPDGLDAEVTLPIAKV